MGGLERKELKNCAEFTVLVAVGEMFVGRGLGCFVLETSGDMQNNKNNNSLALPPSINNVPKMADIIASLNLCCFLLSFLR